MKDVNATRSKPKIRDTKSTKEGASLPATDSRHWKGNESVNETPDAPGGFRKTGCTGEQESKGREKNRNSNKKTLKNILRERLPPRIRQISRLTAKTKM